MNENSVFLESTWGGDVELIAASAILETYIYIYVCVANDSYKSQGSSVNEVRWSQIRAANYTCNSSIYITNFCVHYEPVKTMLNSPYLTYRLIDEMDLTDI